MKNEQVKRKMTTLIVDVVYNVFPFLDKKSKYNASIVSREWANIFDRVTLADITELRKLLAYSIVNGRHGVLDRLFEIGIFDIMSPYENFNELFVTVAENGRLDILRWLFVNCKCLDIDECISNGLDVAIEECDWKIVDFLWKNCTSISGGLLKDLFIGAATDDRTDILLSILGKYGQPSFITLSNAFCGAARWDCRASLQFIWTMCPTVRNNNTIDLTLDTAHDYNNQEVTNILLQLSGRAK